MINLYYNKFKKINNEQLYIYINLYNSQGFGNLLFMVACGLALSYANNRPCKLLQYKPVRKDRPHIKKYKIFSSFEYIERNNIINYIEHVEDDAFIYRKINLANKNYIITGYYQSYKYFENYIDKIKSYLFQNIKELVEQTTIQFNKLKNNKKTVLLHVRRGDYWSSDAHYIIDESYYEASLNTFFQNNNIDDWYIFLFTDDFNEVINWPLIKKYNIQFYGDPSKIGSQFYGDPSKIGSQFYGDPSKIGSQFINETNPEIIFLLMIQFDHYIIANSSLSLISYYFRNNKDATLSFPPCWVAGVVSFDDMIPDNMKQHNNMIPSTSLYKKMGIHLNSNTINIMRIK